MNRRRTCPGVGHLGDLVVGEINCENKKQKKHTETPKLYDSGYPHDGRADKNPYPHDRRADKDSYPHDSNNQCIILRLQLSFMMINE